MPLQRFAAAKICGQTCIDRHRETDRYIDNIDRQIDRSRPVSISLDSR